MTNQNLKGRLKGLKKELIALGKEAKNSPETSRELVTNQINIAKEIYIINKTLNYRKNNISISLNLKLSSILSSMLIFSPYTLPIKLILIAMSTIFLFILIHSALNMIISCHRPNILLWIACAKKTLPEWKEYRKQVKQNLYLHCLFFCLWFLVFISMIQLTVFSFITIFIGTGIIIDLWLSDFHRTKFDETSEFLETFKRVNEIETSTY